MLISDLQTRFDAVLIWGFGKEGASSLRFFRDALPDIAIFAADTNRQAAIEDSGVAYVPDQDIASFCAARNIVVIKSPGISIYGEIASALKQQGTPITSQLNIFLANRRADLHTIGVTGTKGKSTTCSLLHHALNGLGRPTGLCGNIGVPPLELDTEALEAVIVEVSSYQAANLEYGFDTTVLLNLGSDHATWHGDFHTYRKDKTNLLRQANGSDVIIGPGIDLSDYFDAESGNNRVKVLDDGVDFEIGADSVSFLGEELAVPPQILGKHNKLNLCIALTVLNRMGVSPTAAIQSLAGFRPLAHRLELIGTLKGVAFVDDGLATTPESCLSAVSVFDGQDVVLILGGADRSQDYSFLATQLKRAANVKHAYLLSENADQLLSAFEEADIGDLASKCASLEDAVKAGFQWLQPSGGVVLLSPAAARAGGYEDSETRGAAFRSAVDRLAQDD